MNFRLTKKNSRKFFCDDCGHWIEGSKDDLRNHNLTPMHRRNHDRKLKE